MGKTRHRFLFGAASLLTVLLLLLPLLIFPVRQAIFQVKSAEILRLGPASDRLERMVFTVPEFAGLNFTRANHEFEYRGNMYDVRSIEQSGNRVIVTVMWDRVESALLIADGHPGSQACPARNHAGVVFMPYFFSGESAVDFHPRNFISELINCIAVDYNDPKFLPAYPPPELLSRPFLAA